ncbi:MAG: divalent metal cation transporter [Verrucomicrobiae bacterium]|nr:divalent metal cation transporter [Verrucomicrobiae bacterium]
MSEYQPNLEEAAELAEINRLPLSRRLGYYAKKSGPGWLQAAITLGGGSLASALFLGVILNYHLMWLQPLAMILGVVMLCAISYVTLSSQRRPFESVKTFVSPVLAWGWLLAAMLANMVWCLPQFALGTGAVQQNLIPSLDGSKSATWAVGAALLVSAALAVRAYDSGGRGVRVFEGILKAMVGIVVVSFFLVVGRLTVSGSLDWGLILSGFLPDVSLLKNPSPVIGAAIAETGANAATWTSLIAGDQRDIIIAAFGTAVGINMTFLLPYSMLRKGWTREHRGLAVMDLGVGLFVPFLLATSCIVIAAASQFHGKSEDILSADGTVIAAKAGGYNAVADRFVKARFSGEIAALPEADRAAKVAEWREALPLSDRKVAAMLVSRKDSDLAKSLSALAGEGVGRIVFGVGVLGMALSTIIILMLINGFCLCEAFNRAGDRKLHFLGSLVPGLIGVCFPLIWNDQSRAKLAVPTSVIGASLLPIAYFTFLLLMNSPRLLGEAMPRGGKRFVLNALMIFATSVATFGSVWALRGKEVDGIPVGTIGLVVLVALFLLGLFGFLSKNRRKA